MKKLLESGMELTCLLLVVLGILVGSLFFETLGLILMYMGFILLLALAVKYTKDVFAWFNSSEARESETAVKILNKSLIIIIAASVLAMEIISWLN
jgi:uncharacterized membrane protein